MPATMTFTGELVITSCWCGINVAIPSGLHTWAQQSERRVVYCPLGHEFVYNDNAAKRALRRAEQAEQDARSARLRAQAERELREHTEHKLRAQKGATTKARKRHAAGVCPACKRTFQQLARHMETQHPDFDPEAHG